MTIKPIETVHAGCRFRSRLEARWAVFFDTLKIAWEYEPQGFMIDGVLYLPDFYLPEQKLWVEVKPADPDVVDPEGMTRWRTFAEKIIHFGDRAALFAGNIPIPGTLDRMVDDPGNRGLAIIIDGDSGYEWCACATWKHFDVQYEGRNERMRCGCAAYDPDGRWAYGERSARPIEEAYEVAARSARFQGGR